MKPEADDEVIPINELREPPLDTTDDEPGESRGEVPDDVKDENISAWQPPEVGPIDTGDPEDPAPGRPLTDEQVDLVELEEDDD
jgi:hypothetical protein